MTKRKDWNVNETALLKCLRKSKKPLSLRDLAARCFGGNYVTAKNAVRRPRAQGAIVQTAPGIYQIAATERGAKMVTVAKPRRKAPDALTVCAYGPCNKPTVGASRYCSGSHRGKASVERRAAEKA